MKKFFLLALILIMSLSVTLFACDKPKGKTDQPPNDENNNNVNKQDSVVSQGFNLFYGGIGKALMAVSSGELVMTVNDGGEPTSDTIVKKSGDVISYDKNGMKAAYVNDKAYFSDNYSQSADISLGQFLAMTFNNLNEINMDYFLFPTKFSLNIVEGGYKINMEASGYPHTYTAELLLDANNIFKSATFKSITIWFTREIELSIQEKTVEGVPLKTVFLESTDKTDTFVNFFEAATAVYDYTQTTQLKMQEYQSKGSESFIEVSKTYQLKNNKALFTYKNAYDYYENGKYYMNDETLTDEYYKKTYYELPFENARQRVFRDIFYFVRGLDFDITVTKSVDSGVTVYNSDTFRCELKDGVLDSLIIKEYNEYESKWYFTKYKFSDCEDFYTPSGFTSSNFISNIMAGEISYTVMAYTQSSDVMAEQFIYYAKNPTTQNYAGRMYSDKIIVIHEAKDSSENMLTGYYYIHEIPSTEFQGSIVAVYYVGTTGVFKAFKRDSDIVYEQLP